ncbi:Serine/threonine-protein phosphatase 2A regulatory subunit B'' subunit alpha [Nowakowskiella sp. JEL0407]|nr:Serine/threonine-protein phosphatase 2A regulatory subunit B'' subunit alpha [Nowakowskiella sp. JEL0407]
MTIDISECIYISPTQKLASVPNSTFEEEDQGSDSISNKKTVPPRSPEPRRRHPSDNEQLQKSITICEEFKEFESSTKDGNYLVSVSAAAAEGELAPTNAESQIEKIERKSLEIPNIIEMVCEDEMALVKSPKKIDVDIVVPSVVVTETESRIESQIRELFADSQSQEGELNEREFLKITIALGLPKFMNAVLFDAITEVRNISRIKIPPSSNGNNDPQNVNVPESSLERKVSYQSFLKLWLMVTETYFNIQSICFGIIKRKEKDHITPDDLSIVVEDVVRHHPGLEFLSSVPVFQQRYVETVVSRIFYLKRLNCNDKMTFSDFKKLGLTECLFQLQMEDDINKGRNMFSYKHFYVIYCKFWELDTDHDMLISPKSLMTYDHNAISRRVIRRVVEYAHARNKENQGKAIGSRTSLIPVTGSRTRLNNFPSGKSKDESQLLSDESDINMEFEETDESDDEDDGVAEANVTFDENAPTFTYRDFIWFILSVEDKKTPQGIEFWFRMLDRDGDGVLSLHELRYFYEEQWKRMLNGRMSDPWKFNDFVCSILDLVKPRDSERCLITLQDIKKSGNAALFFDKIFDMRKYEIYMRRIDPMFREMDDLWTLDGSGKRIKLEGWEKFAERAYDELASEEIQGRSNYSNYCNNTRRRRRRATRLSADITSDVNEEADVNNNPSDCEAADTDIIFISEGDLQVNLAEPVLNDTAHIDKMDVDMDGADEFDKISREISDATSNFEHSPEDAEAAELIEESFSSDSGNSSIRGGKKRTRKGADVFSPLSNNVIGEDAPNQNGENTQSETEIILLEQQRINALETLTETEPLPESLDTINQHEEPESQTLEATLAAANLGTEESSKFENVFVAQMDENAIITGTKRAKIIVSGEVVDAPPSAETEDLPDPTPAA